MDTHTPSLDNLTDEQLEQALKARQASKKAAETAAREQYNQKRDALAKLLAERAYTLEGYIADFHEEAKRALIEFREESRQYGGVRANSKGGFSIETNDYKATLRFHAIWTFDERAAMAEELLTEFLGDTVKKKDKALYEILLSLLQRNKDGKLEPRRVMDIISHEDKYTDERWRKAIKLLKESYQERGSKYYMEFARKTADGKWEPINLNFASL